jgi:endonuclease G
MTKRTTPRFRFAPSVQVEAKRVKAKPAPLESYLDRTGYDPGFIGATMLVGLPVLGAAAKRDVATFTWKGKRTHALDYTHFTTVVSKSRRMPVFSACNIDGASLRKVDRGDVWKYDPRIPLEYQVLEEPFGNQRDGYFSRGHMTRRKDPDWGSAAQAKAADADTFHATNAAPQVQKFNDGLWGEIEDYVLANCGKDQMRISVFTGPVFDPRDPVIHGVQVPLAFWKIIAFVHDETGLLHATGYVSSQAKDVAGQKPAFVFGEFAHQQRTLVAIEQLTGLKFPDLTPRDVVADAGAGFAVALRDVRDIMLI